MSYNIPNWGSISANSGPIWVGFHFGAGENKGALFSMGLPQSSGAYLISFEHEIDNNNGGIGYWFKLTNIGNQPTSFTLCGGGLN